MNKEQGWRGVLNVVSFQAYADGYNVFIDDRSIAFIVPCARSWLIIFFSVGLNDPERAAHWPVGVSR